MGSASVIGRFHLRGAARALSLVCWAGQDGLRKPVRTGLLHEPTLGRQFLLRQPPVDGRATIEGRELHHLARVLRARPGDEVVVFDGQGARYRASLEDLDLESARVRILEILEPSTPALELTIATSTPKGGRGDVLVEKLAELGVAQWQPLLLERTPPSGRPGAGRLARWRRLAESASKQCGRGDLLTLGEPCSLSELIERAPIEGRLLGSPSASAQRLTDLLQANASGRVWTLVIGPEGGPTPSEEAQLAEASFQPVRFADLVLRVETAALTAAAVFAAWCGGHAS